MQSRDIVFDLEFNQPVESLWTYWVENEKLERWLTAKANVEPRYKGFYELFWNPATPQENSTIDCQITSMDPGRLLSFQWRGPVPFADLMNTKPFPTWVSISFESLTLNSCVLHFRHSGWGESKEWSEAREWQKKAWSMAFKNLSSIATEHLQ